MFLVKNGLGLQELISNLFYGHSSKWNQIDRKFTPW
jgi:hypothetical protein